MVVIITVIDYFQIYPVGCYHYSNQSGVYRRFIFRTYYFGSASPHASRPIGTGAALMIFSMTEASKPRF